MPTILFVCKANQFRSPIAAACLRQIVQRDFPEEQWGIGSAGTWAENGLRVPDISLQVAEKLNLSGLTQHRSRRITPTLLGLADLVIVMEGGQKEALRYEFPAVANHIFQISEIVTQMAYDIDDIDEIDNPRINPEEVGDILFQLISKGSANILNLARELHAERNATEG